MSWFGIVKNIFGKTEKNAKVKEGECIFPFKYKWEEHNECVDTDKGPICATEVNPQTKTLTKYGYCQKRSIKKLSSAEKKEKRKSLTSSPRLKKTLKKRKLKKKFIIAEVETQSTMEKSRVKPKFKLLSPLQGEKLEEKKKLKTIKKKIPKTLKIIEESIDLKPVQEVIQEETMKPVEQLPIPKIKTYNEEFIEVLGELADLMQGQGEIFRAKAYQKAQEAIMLYEGDITDPNQLKGMKGIGETILSKLNEYVETGTIKALEKQRKNPINVLTKVYGIGPKKAQELIKKDITTIEKLRENEDELNDIQKVGLKYYEDINERIPRVEIDEYKDEFIKSFEEVAPEESKFEIVGSYRRQKQMSGDIDVIITNNKGDESVFKKFVDDLIKKGIIIEVLSRGKSKCLVITRLEGKKARRVDFLYTPPSEYAFAILYFTGSKAFNTVMRQRALDRGYTLNEHGISVMTKAIKGEKGVKGDKVSQDFPSEKSIFDFLDMQYKYPNERIDGRAVQNKITDVEVIELNSVKTSTIQQEKVDDVEKMEMEDVEEKKVMKKAKKVIKNVTLKKRKINPVELIEKFKQDGISALKSLSESELEAMLVEANESYYIKGESLMTDNQYDILREHMLERYPDNAVAIDGHAAIELKVSKNKVKLPYEMWSMDKIKPDTDALKKWIEKFPDPYIVSCKLDGVSGLYVTEGTGKPKLYTRGNGIIGQDITHLIPYLKMPKGKGFAVRGEFIISKSKFEEKYSKEFANPRNFVAGLINKKVIEPEKLRDLDFVTYEVIKPDMKPSQQFKYLEDREAEVVRYVKLEKISNEILSELLVTWRNDYKYEIDGVICTHDEIHPRVSGNPEYAFAFKMVLSEQVAEAKVVDVLWTPTKDGFLKPRVQIEPISLGGVTITYATGFNAKFIEENKIGVGAVVQLVRSGDVIPHILSVPVPADKPLMPAIPYEWNESHVDIMLVDGKENEIVREKNIEFFFNKLEVEGFKIGKIKKVIEAGYDTIPKILRMTPEDFQKIEGFAKKSANQIQASIAQKIAAANLVKLMMATNFARGIGDKKISAIIDAIPDILTSNKTVEQKIAQIKTVKGNSDITARKFVEGIPEFLEFISEAGLQEKLAYIVEEKKGDETHPLYGKKIVMTGFRDKELGEMIESVGGELSAAVSKNTFIVLVKDIDESTGKAGKARELGIELMTPDDFKKKYF